MNNSKSFFTKNKKFFKTLGPGIITGASDDDPSPGYCIVGSINYIDNNKE